MILENQFLVVKSEAGLFISAAPAPLQTLTREEALSLAAWLAVVADGANSLSPNCELQVLMRAIVHL